VKSLGCTIIATVRLVTQKRSDGEKLVRSMILPCTFSVAMRVFPPFEQPKIERIPNYIFLLNIDKIFLINRMFSGINIIWKFEQKEYNAFEWYFKNKYSINIKRYILNRFIFPQWKKVILYEAPFPNTIPYLINSLDKKLTKKHNQVNIWLQKTEVTFSAGKKAYLLSW